MDNQKDINQIGGTNPNAGAQNTDHARSLGQHSGPERHSNDVRPKKIPVAGLHTNEVPHNAHNEKGEHTPVPAAAKREGFGYILRKTEKLTTALYLVTDIMSEREPMKWKAREMGVELLSEITIAASLSPSETMTALRNATKKTEKVIAFLDVALTARLISEMNASVLRKEYAALKDSIQNEWTHVYEKSKSMFSDSFFEVPKDVDEEDGIVRLSHPAAPLRLRMPERREIKKVSPANPQQMNTPVQKKPVEEQVVRPIKPIGQNISQGHESVVTPAPTQPIARESISEKNSPVVTSRPDPVAPMNQMSHSVSTERMTVNRPVATQTMPVPRPTYMPTVSSMWERSRVDHERDDRRKIILALIKQKPALTVKDIAKSIPNVSEKTIQRELFAMVGEGTLEKRGERRWSTYSLRNG